MKEIINNYLKEHNVQLEKREIKVISRGLKDYRQLKEIMNCLDNDTQYSETYLLALKTHQAACFWK